MPALRHLAASLVALALTQSPALAQQVPPPPPPVNATPETPPDAAPSVMSDVARLSFVEGEVSVTDGGSGEWTAGQVNAPLVGGDEVATAIGARAELQLDSQNGVRLDGDTQLRLSAFTREQVVVEVSRGRIAYAFGTAPVIPVQIAGPVVTFQPREAGFYIFAVAPDGTTRITVRRGTGGVFRGEAQSALARGQTAVIAPGERGEIRIEPAAFPDAWESWVIQREDQARGAQSWGQLNNNYVGAQDLDHSGDWREAPDYGRVWVPRNVGPGWAPYREGYWVWKPYWGWVWVSNEPWGWTPYHYGRWVMVDGAWAWWPGPVTVHYVPVWAPAYVAFFDVPRHHARPGHVAWLPLGPADWCHPWWSRHNGPRPGGPGPARVEASLLAGKFAAAHHGPAMRPLVPPGSQKFSVLASASQDARVRSAASDLPASKFGQRQVRSENARLDDASFRRANLMVGAAPAMPANAPPPRSFGPGERNFAPRPAALGLDRPQGADKPMARPPFQPSAIAPQKIPGGPDAGPRNAVPSNAVPGVPPMPRRDTPAPDTNFRRNLPKPFAPAQPNAAPNAPAPAASVIRPPQPNTGPGAGAPAFNVIRPQPSQPQERLREFPRNTPKAPTTAPVPQVVRPVEPPRPARIEPVQPPQAVRPVEPVRPMHVEPPRAPAPQMQRPTAPVHVERPSPPPQMQRPAAPAHVERPSPPPQRASPPSAPPQHSAPARQEAPRNAPARNCGPKPCS